MLLSKVNTFRPFLLWKTYSAWLGFCICTLILTNGFASLTLIRAYRFSIVDILLTYGLLIFWGILEAVIFAALLVLIEVTLERAVKKRFELVFRVILVVALIATWLILFFNLIRLILR
jgi:hypothetical protein